MNTLRLSIGTARYSELTTVPLYRCQSPLHSDVHKILPQYIKTVYRNPTSLRGHHCTSLQLSIPSLPRYTQNITSIPLLIMPFCTVHIQKSSPQSLCNVCGELRRSADGRPKVWSYLFNGDVQRQQ